MDEIAIDPAGLRSWVSELLSAHRTPPEKAERVADLLVEADRCGHRSHGVRQLPYYIDLIRAGDLLVDAEPVVEDGRGGLLTLDGRHGFGHLVADRATDLALETAARHSVAAVAVRNAGHVGRLGAYTQRIADAGMVGLLFVNNQGGEQQVAPAGACERRLSNNPISLAAPGGALLDMALSVGAEGRVDHARERGERLPEGWILDSEGSPSDDPADYLDGGSLLPLGGPEAAHKGYGLIVLVEMVVGLLTGGGMCDGPGRRFSNAFVLVCIDPGETARADYLGRLPGLVSWVKSARRLPGVEEVLVPGEPEARRRAPGGPVVLDAPTRAALDRLAERAGIHPVGG